MPFTGFMSPNGVAVDSAGNVYVTDAGNKRVLKLPKQQRVATRNRVRTVQVEPLT